MDAKEFSLPRGIKVNLRAAVGYDVVTARGVYSRMTPFLKHLEGDDSERTTFCYLVVQSEGMSGLAFNLPSTTASGDELAEAYLKFLKLPRKIIRAFDLALSDADDAFEDESVLPPLLKPPTDK
jgi:hypothetical protein